MPIIANTPSSFGDFRDAATVHDMLELSIRSERGLGYLPDLQVYAQRCDRARIEVAVEIDASSEVGEKSTPAVCRVYTIQVFALHATSVESQGPDSIARYQLDVDPDSELGRALGEQLKPYVGLSTLQQSFLEETNPAEALLHQIDELVSNHPTATWNVFPEDGVECVTEDEIRSLARSREDVSMMRIIPSFHEFVQDRSSINTGFVSTAHSKEHCFVLKATLHPKTGSGTLELRTHDNSGTPLNREVFKMLLRESAPDEWLNQVRHRVRNQTAENTAGPKEYGEQEAFHRLLSLTIDSVVECRNSGPGAVRSMFPRWHSEMDAEGLLRDGRILEGLIDPDANELWQREDNWESYGNPRAGNPYVRLEVGYKVARVSVNANSREGCSTIAWYLKSRVPFSNSDTTKLEKLWRAAEMLQSPSEAKVLWGLAQLCKIATPKYVGPSRLQDLVDFDVTSISGVEFAPGAPALMGQMARVVEGTEDIEAYLIEDELLAKYPQNFRQIRFSLHNDGALSLQASNAFRGRLTAFIPASGFEAENRSRSEVIELISKLLVWHPEHARRRLHAAVASLAEEKNGWLTSIGNDVDAPGIAADLPPIDAERGNRAYEHAAKIARVFADVFATRFDSIPIKLLKSGSIRPTACCVVLAERLTRSELRVFTDHEGIKAVLSRPGRIGAFSLGPNAAFVRRSGQPAPFATERDLRRLFGEYKNLRGAFRRYIHSTGEHQPHTRGLWQTQEQKQGDSPNPLFEMSQPAGDMRRIVAHLSEQMVCKSPQ